MVHSAVPYYHGTLYGTVAVTMVHNMVPQIYGTYPSTDITMVYYMVPLLLFTKQYVIISSLVFILFLVCALSIDLWS